MTSLTSFLRIIAGMKFHAPSSCFLLVFLLSFACQTPKQEPIVMPSQIEQLFTSCFPGEGTAYLDLWRSDGETSENQMTISLNHVTSDLDWVSENGRNLTIELTNPLGQTLLTLGLRDVGGKLAFIVEGSLKKNFDESGIAPTVSEDGFISVGRYILPIRYNEIPCLLKHVIPQSWRGGVTSFGHFDGLETAFSMTIEHEDRRIKTNVSIFSQSPLDIETCSLIEWSSLWKRTTQPQIKWCQQIGKKNKGRIFDLGGYTLEWTKLNE